MGRKKRATGINLCLGNSAYLFTPAPGALGAGKPSFALKNMEFWGCGILMIMTKYVLNSGGLKNNPQRAREFFAEVWRRQDLIRFGVFGDAWWEKTADADDHYKFFPIPQQQIDANPNLVQNPGY